MAGKKKSVAKASKTTKKGDSKSGEKELKAALKRLQGRLDKAEDKVEQWKVRAKEQGARVKKLEKKLAGPARPAASRAAGKVENVTADPVAVAATVTDPSDVTTPDETGADSTRTDETWTVTRLRAEARTRGVVNYSRKTKAQLLAELG